MRHVPIELLHGNLSTDDKGHEHKTDRHANKHLDKIRVTLSNLDLNLSLRVNSGFIVEVGTLSCHVLEIAAEPLVSNDILLALPALVE